MMGYVVSLLFLIQAFSYSGGQPPSGGSGPPSGGSGPPPAPVWSTTLETQLRTEIFTDYEVQQRPSGRVNVDISFNLLSVNDMNIKDQTLTISSYLDMHWDDSRLSWTNPSSGNDYSSVKFLFSSETYVWRPTLIFTNAVENMAIISDTKVPMRIKNTGRIIWNPFGIYILSCESDITYYPLDKQECAIKLSSWAYTTSEITLESSTDEIDLNFYSGNGEWDIVGTKAEQSADVARKGISFSSLTYTVNLKRKLLFHVLNTLFPVALMAFLIPMVFKLHVDSGEKVGYALTVLLAYAVYLTMISDSIPSTSVSVCFLSIYLVFVLAMGTFAVLCTLLVIDMNHRTSEVGQKSKFVIKDVIGRMVCSEAEGCVCARKTKVHVDQKTNSNFHDRIVDASERIPEVEIGTPNPDDDEVFAWQDASYIMDRFFYYLFMSLIVLSTLIYMALIFIQY